MNDRLTRASMCCKCKQRGIEIIEGYGDVETFFSPQCERCNNRDVEQANERREWDYYHPKD